MTRATAPSHFFLPRAAGQRLCVHHTPHRPAEPVTAALVYVHPFAEEMNKSRRMAALQARALAKANCAVLQIDLLGCGDSSGLLSDARWTDWLDDVQAACDWIVERYPDVPLWLWGLRSGALLAADACRQRAQLSNLLLWQPVTAGKAQVLQFLRLKAAASLNDGAAAKSAIAELREALAAGQTVEVAGYPLSAVLLQAMEAASLGQPRVGCNVRWFEVSTRAGAAISPGSAKILEAWRADGLDVQAQVIDGPAFWQSAEIEEAPALLGATVQAVCATLEAAV